MNITLKGLTCAVCCMLALALGACSPKTTTTVVPNPEAEATATMTPLQRGTVRRQAEEAARTAVDAWIEGDREVFAEHFGELPQQLLFERWDEAEQAGHTIQRNHEFVSLDVFEMNATGTQALAKYRFKDNTVVLDANGAVIESGGGIDAEFQFTMEPLEEGSDDWIVVRMVGTNESIR